MTKSSTKPTLHAYQVRESNNGKSYWTRIGAAWSNKDGGFSIQLDSIPLDGRIVCRPPKDGESDDAGIRIHVQSSIRWFSWRCTRCN
ncbi:MAG: hypothetical protein ABL888_00630 [Pirellulaceae bacterium]